MKNVQVTQRLANHVASVMGMQLNDELVHQVKRVFLDYICTAITGSDTEVSRLVYHSIQEIEGEGKYNVIGHEKGLSITNAAFINGTSAHCLDLDDGHSAGSIHPATVVLPAVLAAAQKTKPTFERLVKATIIGYDVCLRISSAMHPSSRKRGFHNTPVAGIFGATAAVSVLYEFKEEDIQNAFGIAASFAGGLFAFLGTGSEVKRIHPGKAARDALLAVELTAKGLSGPKSVLECENGVFQAFAGDEIFLDRLFKDIGEQYEIMNIYFKPYPCCRHLHSSVDAVYELKDRFQFKLEEISSIRVGVNNIAYLHRHKEFHSLLDTQMSLPFAVVASLIHPMLEIPHFNPMNADETTNNLVQLVEVYIDEDANNVYPKERLAKLEILLKNGEILHSTVRNPLGEPDNPLSDEKLEQKALVNCTPVIGEEKTRRIIDQIKNMEREIDFLYQI